MTDPLKVTPDGLRGASDDVEGVSAHVEKVQSLVKKIDAEGAAWGDDKMGRAFAEGPQGYIAQRDDYVKPTLAALKQFLADMSDALKQTGDHFEQGDQS